MRSYEAGVFDIYDDGGNILKEAVPDQHGLPDFVKTASLMRQQDNSRLFALVMVDDGKVMKKFATADRGNTWLSTLYFAFTRDKLPEEAQKVAAANLVEACEAFDIAPPDYLFDVADGPSDTNIVDVTGLRPPMQKVAHVEKEEVEYAIERADGSKHYPLRNAAEVQTAQDYFERNVGEFVPRERREYAVKVAAKARQGRLPIKPAVAKYAGAGWNPAVEGHITQRYVHLTDVGAELGVKEQLVKIAHSNLEPEQMAHALEVFDREFGLDAMWDRELADPWFAITGEFVKEAKGDIKPDKTWDLGDTRVTSADLNRLAERGLATIINSLGDDFAKAFQANPIVQFEALPAPQKKFVARMATNIPDDPGMG
jgi:hypothetical protein